MKGRTGPRPGVPAPVRSASALVPYRAPGVPALPQPSLGDIEAFIRAANAAPVLSAEEERQLAIDLRDKNDLVAAQKLILSHLRLVVSIARGYLGYGLPYPDLIQEGNIGLMKAIRRYDPDRGVRLMTFAQHWIHAEIKEYIVRNWRLVKLATTKNQRKLFFNLRQLSNGDHSLTRGEAEEIAETLDVKPEEVLDMEERMRGGETPFDPGEDDDDEDGRGSFAPSAWLTNCDQTPEREFAAERQERLEKESLRRALSELDARSRRVVEARWLAEDEDGNPAPATLQELAKELGVSAERVRQIEKKALAKLREILTADTDVFGGWL